MVTLLHDTRRAVPFSVFNEGKAGEVFDEVKHSGARVVMKNDTAECVLMSPEYYEKFMDDYNDMKLLALAIERWEHYDPAKLISQEEMDRILGITPEDLEGWEEIELE